MMPFDLAGKRVYVAGHRGMVGAALVRRLASEPVELLTANRSELDLTRQAEVEAWLRRERPEVVVVAAAEVGGILANASRPVDFLERNLLIETHLIRAAFEVGRGEAAVPRQLLHLPAGLPAADPRGVPADRPARAHQRGLRAGQDRRDQAVPGLPAAARVPTSSAPCRPTSTARATISTSRPATSSRR